MILQQTAVEHLCNKESNSTESGLEPLHQSLWRDCPQQLVEDAYTSLDHHLNVIDQDLNKVLSQSEMQIQLALTVCFLMKFHAPSSSEKVWREKDNNSVLREEKGVCDQGRKSHILRKLQRVRLFQDEISATIELTEDWLNISFLALVKLSCFILP